MKRSISLSGPGIRLFLLILGITLAVEGLANAQGQPSSSVAEEEKLEQDFTDPLTTLPQLIIRDSYTPANYGPCTPLACTRDYETNQLIVRPLIPRIPPRSFLPFNQLIRPTLALVTVPSSRGGTRTEFGDLSVFDVAVLPWPDRKETGLLIGIGPTFVLPTATSGSAGHGAWQVGPAWSHLCGYSRAAGGIHRPEPSLFRLHIAQSATSEYVPSSTGVRASSLGQMVLTIRGGHLDACLAATFSHYVAAEYRDRPDIRSSRAASDELVCYRTVDGVSAVRSDRAADDDQLWHHCSISPTSILLGSLG